MYLLVSRYTAPEERIAELVPAHREYLAERYAAGDFVLSGRRVPWVGGVIVAASMPRERLDELLALDPFAVEGVAETDVVEFEPLFADERLRFLLP
jgi:uncharacterized protein YciI